MTDTATNQPLRVQTDSTGKYSLIDLPVDQLDRVRALLDAGEVPYWVQHGFTSYNGGPYMAVIHLRRKADPKKAQALLDAVIGG
jgi:hypothetical protein